ncbi:helix-turn-helix transcriptional regulator [Rhizobiaceae bacterium LC148]|nr:AraC family transcriptional regulator [Rhizobium sp. LC145]TKT55062.1 helix-turn-helix transcriptional regulator [Rhizobiaceae bacterium LC148]
MLRKLADASLLDPWPENVGPRMMAFRGGAVHSKRPATAQEFLPTGHWIGVIMAPSPEIKLAFGSEKYRTSAATVGMLAVHPAGVDGKARWATALENVLVSISPESMLELAARQFDCVNLEVRPTHLTPDRTALELAELIKANMNSPDACSELYLDTLITILGIHVLRHYSNIASPSKTRADELSPIAAKRIRDYLHEHFRRKLTITELAEICGLSRGHFARSFVRTFRVSVDRYLLEIRLDSAERLLLETELPLSEVARLSGFSGWRALTTQMMLYRQKSPDQLRSV